MTLFKHLLPIAAAACLIQVDAAPAQDEPKPKPKMKIVSAVDDDAQRAALEADLRSGDQARIDAAIATIGKAVLTRGKGRPGDLNVLLAAGFASEAEAICVRGMTENPANSAMLATFARQRVRCLQAKKDYPAALSAAKTYYNICSDKDVPYAKHLLSQCISAAFPDDPDLRDRFERQQLAGAFAGSGPPSVPTTSPADHSQTIPPIGPSTEAGTPDPLGAPVLASIKIDPQPFREAIEDLAENDYADLVSKANLLLLSDKPEDAIDLVSEAIEMAPPKKLQAAHELMARAIRAQNGRTGEAEAYLSTQAKGANQ